MGRVGKPVKNTDDIIKRAHAKLWILRRLKVMGAKTNTLRLIYFRHVRSILEFGAPAWNGALTVKQAFRIERVHKVAVHIMYGKFTSY